MQHVPRTSVVAGVDVDFDVFAAGIAGVTVLVKVVVHTNVDVLTQLSSFGAAGRVVTLVDADLGSLLAGVAVRALESVLPLSVFAAAVEFGTLLDLYVGLVVLLTSPRAREDTDGYGKTSVVILDAELAHVSPQARGNGGERIPD